MSEYLQKIIYLSQNDYDTLEGGGSVTHNNTTLTGLNPSYIYITDTGITENDLGNTIIPISNGGTGLNSADPHKLLIGPSSGSTAAAPTWRILADDDIPTSLTLTSINAPTTSNGTTYGVGTDGQVLRSNGTSNYWASLGTAADKDVINNTSIGALGWNSGGATNANNLRILNVNTLAYWNGAYSSTTSNLAYCNKGAFGNIVTTDFPTSSTTTTFLRGDGTWTRMNALYTKTIGTDSDTFASAIQTYFVNDNETIPRNELLALQTYADNNSALSMGYFISGNDSAPYGGFFVARYNTPYYVGISNGTYTNQAILTDAAPVSIANGGTGVSNKLDAGFIYDWTAIIQGQKWSRIFYLPASISVTGSTFILNITSTRSNVVYNYTFLVTSHHSSKCSINMIQGSTYSPIQVRGVVNSSGHTYFEIYDNLASIASGTNQNVVCKLWVLTKGTTEPTLYTSFTDGTTLPSGFTAHAIQLQASGGIQTNGKIYGAVWNDYAEYRQTNTQVIPGQCVIDNTDGTLSISTKRLQPGAQIVSDTFGFAIGETSSNKTPLAVSGRVLAYPYRDRTQYQAGMAVCSAPNGTVDIMTREEIQQYPDCIIGIVSEVPEYKTWGTENIAVNGRIWIKVK